MRLLTEEDCFNGPIYTRYPLPRKIYTKRAELFRGYPDPILVVACGFGLLVTELLKLNKRAWGIDAAPYCEKHFEPKCSLLSILDRVDVGMLQATHGYFGTVITEDLLPHLTDEEVKLAAGHCELLGPIVIHLITERGEADLNYRSTAECMNLTKQLTVSLEGM